MKNRQEVFEDVNKLQDMLTGVYSSVFIEPVKETLFANFHKVLDYTDENDKWEQLCWGTDECVTYICLYILLDCLFIDGSLTEPLENTEAFFNFIEKWFKEHVDHYMKMVEKNIIKESHVSLMMVRDCAVEIVKSLKETYDFSN
jgi:hypothetical protein